MSTIFSIINLRRKHAFFLRQTALLILPLLAKPRSGYQSAQKQQTGSDAGLLTCLKKVCDVYGVGDVVDNEDFSAAVEDVRPLAFGWPDLQIDILKDALTVSEALPGIIIQHV